MHTVCIDFQKFVKKCPVIDYCLTHFFRAGFIALPPQRQRTSGSVILHDHGMIDRQVVRTLIEVFEGVAPRGHYVRDELIGFCHGAFRVIDKASLNTPPFAGECIDLIFRKRAQIETTDTISALLENRFSACLADSLYGSLVLGPKAFA